MHQIPTKIAQYWSHVQAFLFPVLEEELGPLTAKHRDVVRTLDLVRIEEFLPESHGQPWRPAQDRAALARAFVAKAVLNVATTRALRDRLESDPTLRRLCGWETRGAVPSESKFSRVFAEFAQSALPLRLHEALVAAYPEERLVGHIARDASAIEARETPAPRPEKTAPDPATPKRKRGRPKKGQEPPPAPPTRLERQAGMTVPEMIADLPTACDIGCKRNSKGSVEYWVGYKLHVDVADGQIPISALLTSASVHDSQAARPLAELTAQRVTSLYDLMDAAYDAEILRAHSISLGHVPLIDRNFKGNAEAKAEAQAEQARLKFLHRERPEDVRFRERTTVERVFARLKDEFGGRSIRVRGHTKIFAHLMFGLLALTADQLLRLAA